MFKISKYPVFIQRITLVNFLSFLILSGCLSSCKSDIEKKLENIGNGSIQASGIILDYPKDNTIFPPEIPAPEFIWKDTLPGQAKYYISVSTDGGEKFSAQTDNLLKWRPDPVVWEKIKTASKENKAFFSVVGEHSGTFGKKYSSGKIGFTFSPDSVGAQVFYRAVPLPFSHALKNIHEIEWYMGHVYDEKPVKILDNIPVCANCHSFSKDGSQFAMDVDYANDKGSYIISPVKDTIDLTFEKVITWSDCEREDGEKTFGLLSQISPDGRYVLSTVKDQSVFVPVDNLEYSQLFFPIKGILAVYDLAKKKFAELSGANNKSMVQSNPNWSPDGKEILFSRTSRYYSAAIENSKNIVIQPEDAEEFVSRQKDFKFDLCRLDFNEGKGGVPMPIPGASGNNASNYFARYSPDGKWIIFCQAENFMLLQPDSKLYIMPAEGGTPRLMNCNTNNMNSWHSWSPNGKWVVFSSKNRGPYTQLYLTHIDEQGNDSPAVFLENLAFNTKAANIPEFFDDRKHNLLKMVDEFSQTAFYYESLAKNNLFNREFISAFRNLSKAIQTDNTFFDAYMDWIMLSMRLGQTGTKDFINNKQTAAKLINHQLQQNPDDPVIIEKRADLEYYTREYEAALNDALKAVKINPDYYDGYVLLSSIYQKAGEMQKTLDCYGKLLKLNPGDKQMTYSLGLYYKNNRNFDQAFRVANELISNYPDEVKFYFLRADLHYMNGNKDAAKSDLDQAILHNPNPLNHEVYLKRGLFWEETGQKDLSKNDFKKAISILTEGIAKNPEDVELLSFRSEVLERIGDLNGVIGDCERYLALLPLNYKVLNQKARIEYSQNLWQNTLETYTILIENFPPQPDFFFNRCYANIKLGNRAQAVADLNKAQDLSRNDYSKLYDIAILKMNLDDNQGAKADLLKLASFLSEKTKKGKLNEADSRLQYMVADQLQRFN